MRYFIVTFNHMKSQMNFGFGDLTIVSNSYPRRKFIEAEILVADSEIESVSIQNIIEISETDYESYKS